MTYLITGATSFLGQEIVQVLQQQGVQVYAVCRDASKLQSEVASQCAIVELPMQDYDRMSEHIRQADVFIHLAWAGTGHKERDDSEIQQKNVQHSLQAIRVAHALGCRLFVMAGSQAEYGSTLLPQTEDMPCKPFSEYGKAKLRLQQEGSRLANELGMKYIHLRIFSLIGENDHPWTLVMSCVDKMLRNEPIDLSACTQNWNFLYVKDAAMQICKLSEYAFTKDDYVHEIYNIASSDTRVLREFMERMRVLTKSESILHYGAVTPKYTVSLQPTIKKTESAVKTDNVFFDTVILRIIKKQQNRDL